MATKCDFQTVAEAIADYIDRYQPEGNIKWWIAQEPYYKGDCYVISVGEEVEGEIILRNRVYYTVEEV
jgi:hypothetical protein